MKTYALIALGLLIGLQLAVPFNMIRGREKVLQDGELFKFRTRPIDPADPFQGRYVRLSYEDDYIPGPAGRETELSYKEQVYVLLETGPNGFAALKAWQREPPAEGHYLKTRYIGRRTVWNPETKKSTYKGLRFDLPFDRFYMEETSAPRAETLAREATRNTNCWANVRILRGKAVIEDVYAAGESLQKLAAKKE